MCLSGCQLSSRGMSLSNLSLAPGLWATEKSPLMSRLILWKFSGNLPPSAVLHSTLWSRAAMLSVNTRGAREGFLFLRVPTSPSLWKISAIHTETVGEEWLRGIYLSFPVLLTIADSGYLHLTMTHCVSGSCSLALLPCSTKVSKVLWGQHLREGIPLNSLVLSQLLIKERLVEKKLVEECNWICDWGSSVF